MGAIAGYTCSSDPALLKEMMMQQCQRDTGQATVLNCDEGVLLAHCGEKEDSTAPEGRYRAVLDGFLANKEGLNRSLGKAGYPPSERESVLLERAWQLWGRDTLLRLEGMFAFALWDREEKSLWLCRDRAGTKPLYYCRHGNALYFASTLKALLCVPHINKDLDPEALDDYLAFLHPLAPRTFYQGIRQIPAGHHALWHGDSLQVQRYWFPLSQAEERGTDIDWLEKTDHLLSEVIGAYGATDKRLGTLLSGGVDSTLVSSYLTSSRESFPAFTLGFDEEEKNYDERKGARETAALLGLELHETFVKPHLPTAADTLLQHFDAPFGNPSVVLAEALFREAGKTVELLFSGDGGDEGFGGYPRYQGLLWAEQLKKLPFSLLPHALPPLLKFFPESATGSHRIRRLRRFSEGLQLDSTSAYALWREQQSYEERHALYSPELSSILQDRRASDAVEKAMEECGSSDLLTQALYSDITLFLPGNVLTYGDRLSKAHGVALRTPLCEGKLLSTVLHMPSSLKTGLFRDKYLLRKLLQKRMPQKHIRRKKMGLDPPMGIWLKAWLSSRDEPAAFVKALDETGLFNADRVKKLMEEHRSQVRDHSWRLWPLLVFSRWHQPGY